MESFFVGDRVRFLDQDGEGVILSIKEGIATVQTADGFEFPYPISALVKVEATAKTAEYREFEQPVSNKVVLGKYGIFLAYMPQAGNLVKVYFINKTSFLLLYSIGENRANGSFGIASGQIKAGDFVEVFSRNRDHISNWPQLVVNVLYHNNQDLNPAPVQFVHAVLEQDFLSEKVQAPILGQQAYLYQLDDPNWQSERSKLNTQLKDAFQGKKLNDLEGLDEVIANDVVDLHLEEIPDAPTNLGLNAILGFQIDYAEKMLDKALAAGHSKITFIHGAGDGVLKREIQKLGREHPHVSSYGKADPNKYGGGATFLKLK